MGKSWDHFAPIGPYVVTADEVDAGNLDIERLRQCSLHVYKDGKHIPFCAYYLSPHGEKGNQST